MGKLDATVQEYFCPITEAEFVTDAPEYDEADHSGRVLQAVEERADPFIAAASPTPTAKPPVASRGEVGPFRAI
jgi:hypothetical protein